MLIYLCLHDGKKYNLLMSFVDKQHWNNVKMFQNQTVNSFNDTCESSITRLTLNS